MGQVIAYILHCQVLSLCYAPIFARRGPEGFWSSDSYTPGRSQPQQQGVLLQVLHLQPAPVGGSLSRWLSSVFLSSLWRLALSLVCDGTLYLASGRVYARLPPPPHYYHRQGKLFATQRQGTTVPSVTDKAVFPSSSPAALILYVTRTCCGQCGVCCQLGVVKYLNTAHSARVHTRHESPHLQATHTSQLQSYSFSPKELKAASNPSRNQRLMG
jgi:hypothetical protein